MKSEDHWVKIVEFLQQNWALIETREGSEAVVVYFIDDGCTVFDSIEFETQEEAELSLLRNGFKKYLNESENFSDLMVPPKPPFAEGRRPIYSSGEFWK